MDIEPPKHERWKMAQRKHLTVLFSDLCGSSELARILTPEEFAEFHYQLVALFQDTIQRHGGEVSQVQGDGVFAVFGMHPREDEGRRATQAALELHQKVLQLELPSRIEWLPALHSGIHSGLVSVIEGDHLLGRYLVVGDAANLAAGLSNEADSNEILVSDVSLGAEQYFFETKNRRPYHPKKNMGPLIASSVVGQSDVHTRYQARQLRGHPELVGRNRELATLRSCFAKCMRGRAQIVNIVAPPGVGKTRLAEDFLRELNNGQAIILRGHCESYLNAEPMQAIRQMLAQMLQIPQPLPSWVHQSSVKLRLAERLAKIHPSLQDHATTIAGILAPSNENPWPAEAELVDSCISIVRQLARSKPVVLFVDDWQWADDRTRSVLRHSRHLPQSALLLVRTSRETIPNDRFARAMHLEPLPETETISLARQLAPDVDSFTLKRISDASGGNPLYVEELCHKVRLDAKTSRTNHSQANLNTHSLNMLIESRLSQLTPEQRSLAEQLAVIGNVAPLWLIKSMWQSSDLDELLEELYECDLVNTRNDDKSVRFKHGIAREVIFNKIPNPGRAEIHLAATKAIENNFTGVQRESYVEMLAYHYSGTEQSDRAANYAEAAGDRALASATMDRTRLQYEAALNALDPGQSDEAYARWMAICQRYSMACLFDSGHRQCQVFKNAEKLARERGDKQGMIEAELSLASIYYALGEGDSADIHVSNAKQLGEEFGSAPLRTRILTMQSQIEALRGNYQHALPSANTALDQLAPYKNRVKVRYSYAYSLASKGMMLGDLGKFDEANECFAEAEELASGPVHQVQGSLMSMRAGALLWQGNWETGLYYARLGVDAGERMGSRYIVASSSALAGYARWRNNEHDARETTRQALLWIESQRQQIWTSMHFSWMSEMAAVEGDVRLARHCAAWSLRRARNQEFLGEAVAYCALALIADQQSSRPEACFQKALNAAKNRGSVREEALVKLKHADWLAKTGDTAAAKLILPECLQQFRTMKMPWYLAEAERLAEQMAARPQQGTSD